MFKLSGNNIKLQVDIIKIRKILNNCSCYLKDNFTELTCMLGIIDKNLKEKRLIVVEKNI